MSKPITIEFDYDLRDKVGIITHLGDITGHVEHLGFDEGGIIYRVTYWHDGGSNFVWLRPWEIRAI